MNKKLFYVLSFASVLAFTGCTGNANTNETNDNASTEENGSSSQGVTIVNPDGVTPEANTGITLADVEKHNSESDCWMAIEGKVYDVTSYIGPHPGGQEILKGCGLDATEFFTSEANGGHEHSGAAEIKKEEFLVGDLK